MQGGEEHWGSPLSSLQSRVKKGPKPSPSPPSHVVDGSQQTHTGMVLRQQVPSLIPTRISIRNRGQHLRKGRDTSQGPEGGMQAYNFLKFP